MNDQEIADYLLANPDFFYSHADLLASIKLADPYRQQAISLQERQLQILRDKQRQLERGHAELMHYGRQNDSIASKINLFATRLLTERDPHAMPQTILAGFKEIFEVPQAALRLWHVAPQYEGADYTRDVDETVRLYANHLTTPYCGANTGFAAAQWLTDASRATDDASAGSPSAASIALLALRDPQQESTEAFGLLALGSDEPQRFQRGMATDFLVQISGLVSAALSRLLPTPTA